MALVVWFGCRQQPKLLWSVPALQPIGRPRLGTIARMAAGPLPVCAPHSHPTSIADLPTFIAVGRDTIGGRQSKKAKPQQKPQQKPPRPDRSRSLSQLDAATAHTPSNRASSKKRQQQLKRPPMPGALKKMNERRSDRPSCYRCFFTCNLCIFDQCNAGRQC